MVFFPPNTWQMMIFLNPLDALTPKIPFSLFAEFWVRVTSGDRGVSLGTIFGGSVNFEPFLRWGSVKPEGCIEHPLPPAAEVENPPTLGP